jgi:hypothetical protein
MKNKLERIFWKEDKWINKEGNEVKPKPIGEPTLIGIAVFSDADTIKEKVELTLTNLQEVNKSKKYKEINRYNLVRTKMSPELEQYSLDLYFLLSFYKE